MKRVLLTGGGVALVDGSLLGVALALGWSGVAVAAAVAGVAGAVLVALATPEPRPLVRPSTVTLGLPLRESTAAVAEDTAPATDATVEPVPEPAPAPVAAPAMPLLDPRPVAGLADAAA